MKSKLEDIFGMPRPRKQEKGCTVDKPAHRVKLSLGEEFNLSDKDYYYCPIHGKCPAVEGTWNHGAFFCEKCGMVKTLDVYGNCHGLADAEVIL